jgi:hypothetical protein
MPEELPVVESIKKIETKQRKRLGKAETPAKKNRWANEERKTREGEAYS